MEFIKLSDIDARWPRRSGVPYVSKESCKRTISAYIALSVNLNSIKAMRFSISTSLIFFWHGINYHAITLKKLAYSLLQLYLILSMT